jgi:diguanylate cyclase (GGDEF)-like protein/PAS domain S-box-containing protein
MADESASGMNAIEEAEEAALRKSETRYRRLFESARDGILILDAGTGQVTDCNPFLEALLGYPHGDLIGRTFWEIGQFRDVAASEAAFRDLQSQNYMRYDNLPLETRDGQQRHVEFISNVYLADNRRVIQCNIRDITERRQSEEETRRTHEELLRLVAELQRRDGEMQRLAHMNDLLQTCTTQDEAYRVSALMAGELFPGHAGCLAISRGWDHYLEGVATWGPGAMLETSFAMEDCWAMRRGQPHEVADAQEGLLCRHFVGRPPGGTVCVPLTVQGETLGVLCLCGAAPGGGEYPTGRMQLAFMVAEAMKLSLSNLRLREKLKEQAIHDPLTGLYNRRYLEENLWRELHRASRRRSSVCVAMLDLDHFKRYNDTFGHESGDAILREFGNVLRDRLRKSDVSCRYGGEEFVLVLPDSTIEDAWRRVEEIRVIMKGLELRHREQLLGSITVSGGLAGSLQHSYGPRELLRAADQALYLAKQAGRDRIMIYRTADMPPAPHERPDEAEGH